MIEETIRQITIGDILGVVALLGGTGTFWKVFLYRKEKFKKEQEKEMENIILQENQNKTLEELKEKINDIEDVIKKSRESGEIVDRLEQKIINLDKEVEQMKERVEYLEKMQLDVKDIKRGMTEVKNNLSLLTEVIAGIKTKEDLYLTAIKNLNSQEED